MSAMYIVFAPFDINIFYEYVPTFGHVAGCSNIIFFPLLGRRLIIIYTVYTVVGARFEFEIFYTDTFILFLLLNNIL